MDPDGIIPRKVIVEDNFYFDYIGLEFTSLKTLAVITDRLHRYSFYPYVALQIWLDLANGTVTCPMTVGASKEICDQVTYFLLKNQVPIGSQIQEFNIEWKTYKLRSLYGHYGRFFLVLFGM